ncbi:MAG: RidA family protein, partial [Pseudolabrys sp.]
MTTTRSKPVPALFEERDEAPRTLQPTGWPRPHGYANGMSARGRVIVTGGMIGCDIMENVVDGFVAQVRLALLNIRAVLAEGGAGPEHIVRLTWYVLDMEEYRQSRKELGRAYREVLGAHYPAMAVV